MAINLDSPALNSSSGVGASSKVRARNAEESAAASLGAGGTGGAAAQAAAAEGGSERISLTDDARRAAELERAMERGFFFDQGRIDSIRSAIRNGEYSINPQRIADKLLQLEQGL